MFQHRLDQSSHVQIDLDIPPTRGNTHQQRAFMSHDNFQAAAPDVTDGERLGAAPRSDHS
jgi:hypothetical protein